VEERLGKPDVDAKMQGDGMRKRVMRGANGDRGIWYMKWWYIHEAMKWPEKVAEGPSGAKRREEKTLVVNNLRY